MKKLTLFISFCFLCVTAFAQVNADSLAYQLQRKKINDMLALRAMKFGQYDQSLSMHTGIFGFQTKKDIRRSNDILMDIVKTDDDIYKELKILLDLRTFQQTQVQTHSKETEDNTIGFITTINKLRNQVDQLKADAAKRQQAHDKTVSWLILLTVILLVTTIYFAIRKRKA